MTWKKKNTKTNHNKYIQSREITDNSKNTALKTYYDTLSHRLIDPKTSAKDYWRLTKELYGNKIKTGIPSLIIGDKVISSAEEKCRIFNDHFTKKSKLPDQLPQIPNIATNTEHSLINITFTRDEVLKTLKNLDISKASGPDGISNTLLKRTAPTICSPLCSLFNKSMSLGLFPTD